MITRFIRGLYVVLKSNDRGIKSDRQAGQQDRDTLSSPVNLIHEDAIDDFRIARFAYMNVITLSKHVNSTNSITLSSLEGHIRSISHHSVGR
jgi:hypothetical protein